MSEVLKIFISATTADLGTARRAARDYFNWHDQFKPREQEHRDLVPATLLANDQHHLKDCDAVLHIVGECYGEEPPASAENGGGAEPGAHGSVGAGAGGQRRSYTQREYDYSRQHGKPLYLFVCEEHFPYTEHPPEPEEKQALQRAHRIAILRGDIRYERIANFAELEKKLDLIKLDSQRLAAELRDTRRSFEQVGEDLAVLRAGITTIDPLQRYYQNLREQFANYDNVGLPVTAREGKEEKEEPIKIRDLFVPPHCSPQHIRPAELDAAVREERTLGEPLLPLLEKPGARVVLLADPGMGKSTVVQYLIATLADGKAPAGTPGLRGAIPFPFILRELARLLPDEVKKWDWDTLLDAFCRWDPRSGEGALAGPIADRATFRTLIESDHAFFLIDGLDEIGDPTKRVAIRDAIWQGFGLHRSARWLITSRLVAYDEAKLHLRTSLLTFDRDSHFVERYVSKEEAELHYLAPFNDTQQHAFAEHWYMPRMGAAKGAGRAREFIAAVHQHPHTRVIGRIPNLLYLLALLYRHQAQLPHGRALVYEAISEAYLESIPLQRLLLGEAAAYSQSFPVKEQLLAIVGMKMQQMRASRDEGEDGDILVSREQLGEWLVGRFESEAALQEFLDHVARHSGLLLSRGEGVYGFAHLSFQEYYAACHLEEEFSRILTEADESDNEQRLFSEYAAQPVWHEPLLFLVEGFRGNKNYTKKVIRWMFPRFADDPARGEKWMPLPAAQLLATLSVDPEVALDLEQRDAIWQNLWAADCATDWHFAGFAARIAPWLVVAVNPFQLAVLQAAAALQPYRLNLSHCTALSDLTPLAGLTGLQELYLIGCTALGDLTPLAGLTGLRELDLEGCKGLGDLAPLRGLAGLRRLQLSGGCTGLSDITPLAGLTGLQEIALGGCTGLSNLTPLAGLTGLQRLYLEGCTGLCDLTPLAGLTGLSQLHLDGCTGLGKDRVAKLRSALPTTQIFFEAWPVGDARG